MLAPHIIFLSHKVLLNREISGSHGGENEGDSLLGYSALYSVVEKKSTFASSVV
jgi:hypothetical protein